MYVPNRVIRPQLEVVAQAVVPTRFGNFNTHVFRWSGGAAPCENGLSPDHVALTMGELDDAEDVLLRVHSECLTSEVFGSLKCDCKLQLEAAQKAVADAERGVILYMRQEGRGIGLANKIRAYELQGEGHDTVDANRLLGLPDDARDYGGAAAMIDHLRIHSIKLMTNNPEKVAAMLRLGVEVSGREPVLVETNPWSAQYLETKRARMGHAVPRMGAARWDAE